MLDHRTNNPSASRLGVLWASSNTLPPILSIIAPCYNEAEGINELLDRTHAAAEKVFPNAYEVILIDDGSSDDTWELIDLAAKARPGTYGIKLSRNYGHQLALSSGLAYARGQLIFVIDADLQDPPELLSAMVAKMNEVGADVVYGKRASRKGESMFKKVSASTFYKILAQNTDVDIPTDTGDFRLMTRRVADILSDMPEPDRFVRGMVAWIGFKQVPFYYDRDVRFAGSTNYPLRKMMKLAAQAFMGFSMLPLRFAGQFAMLMFLIMIVASIYALVSWIFLETVAGWTSIMVLVSFTSAIQLLVLSVLGEYVGRIYMAGKGRPLFIVDKVVGGVSEMQTVAADR